jgi:hypothetical protein
MVMTGLPLVWGEKGPFEPGSRPAAAYRELSRSFELRPVDVLDPATLALGRTLLLVQPQRLSPGELADLDTWIRRGGRALILTDPMLAWPSELPPGDIRRPPPVGMLAPLLDHWRLTMDPPPQAGEVEARWEGRRLLLDSPGRLSSAGAECVVDEGGLTALCRLGLGSARVVADADLMRDSLWERRTAENPAVVGEWMHELAGTVPSPPRRQVWNATIGKAAFFVLPAVLVGIGLLLRRRVKR